MKKILLLSSATFCSILFLNAQQTHFGIKAGLNMATINYDKIEDYDSKAGLHAGILAHIHVSDHFAVQPELVYSMQGGKGADHKLQTSYLNLPVLAQYMFSNGFRLQTGPQLGVLLNAERKANNGVEADVKSRLKTVDFAWTLGGGYLFPAGIGIDARYNLGLSNINEPSELIKGENRVFQVGLFYQFMHQDAKKK